MLQFRFLSMALLLCWGASRWAVAEPAFGGNCLSCHGEMEAGLVEVFNYAGLANPDESRTGAPDRGALPTFQVLRGGTQALHVEVQGLVPGDTYAVQLKRFRFLGVEGNGRLTYSGDCGWCEWGESAFYYTEPAVSYCWNTGPTTFGFDLDVHTDADLDFFDLVFAVAGRYGDNGGLFYSEGHFYVQVIPLLGDLNCDGAVNNLDIDHFIQALLDPARYVADHDGSPEPPCELINGDFTGDGNVNNQDINGFVAALFG